MCNKERLLTIARRSLNYCPVADVVVFRVRLASRVSHRVVGQLVTTVTFVQALAVDEMQIRALQRAVSWRRRQRWQTPPLCDVT